MATSISNARTQLHRLLTVATASGSGTAIAGVQLSFGPPIVYEEQEVIALRGVRIPQERTVVLGNRSREEDFFLVVDVKHYDPAGDAESVDQRGWAMADAVWKVVDDNTKLPDAAAARSVDWAVVAGRESDGALPAMSADGLAVVGWGIVVTVLIHCRARITA